MLRRANKWFMDGNFSLAPPVCDQHYVIRAPLGTTCISCVYTLLPGKTETVYTEMLEAVTDACTALGFNADPTTVVTDFEMAAMHAVTAVFGQQVHVQGCFFHLCQSTWRHVQDLGLTALYNADDVAKQFVRSGTVATGGRAGRDGTSSRQHPQHLDDVIDYFDATYVTGRRSVVQPPAAKATLPVPPARLRGQPLITNGLNAAPQKFGDRTALSTFCESNTPLKDHASKRKLIVLNQLGKKLKLKSNITDPSSDSDGSLDIQYNLTWRYEHISLVILRRQCSHVCRQVSDGKSATVREIVRWATSNYGSPPEKLLVRCLRTA